MKRTFFVNAITILLLICTAAVLVACGGTDKKRDERVAEYEKDGYVVSVKDDAFVDEHNAAYGGKKADTLKWCFVATKNEVLNADGAHYSNYVVTVYYFDKISCAENFGKMKNAEEPTSMSGCEYSCRIDWENNLITVTEGYTYAIDE